MGIGIWLCAAEMMMGCMLMFKVRLRLISIFAVLTMSVFTILTFVIAVWNPLDDCGCFGEAIEMNNWLSFAKNVVLLPMSIILWNSRRGEKIFAFSVKEIILTVVFASLAGGLGIYSWRNLPPIDLFVFKKGVNLREDVLCTGCSQNRTTLIYKNTATGENREFELSDTTWYDSTTWEYVDTRTPFDNLTPEELAEDFAVYDGETNVSDMVVNYPGEVRMAIVRDLAHSSANRPERLERMAEFMARNSQAQTLDIFVVVKNDDLAMQETVNLGGIELPLYTMESEALGKLLRADEGIVIIRDGIITEKFSCWNIK